GDVENLNRLQRRYPGKVCPNPSDIEARTLVHFHFVSCQFGFYSSRSDTNTGLICRKRDQPDRRCADYKVRFSCPPPYCADTEWGVRFSFFVCCSVWTRWYDRDDTSGTGDWKTLTALQNQNRGDICKQPLYIKAVTADTLTPAINTGEILCVSFICHKKDQTSNTCRDYKVRFGCPCGY
uniref:WxxW domain-containing protein n=1 Tax=Fundulus heteroclitus TaxID=8078 RepID=A0A3Q2R255_FUNHE